MKLLSINVSLPKRVEYEGRVVLTGIFKEPVEGTVAVSRTQVAGDGQADLQEHGGVNMAVYVYSFDHYAHWEQELSRNDFTFGQFGENFTVEGMGEDEVCIGDVYRIGSATFEVSQPRVPCSKLAIRMQNNQFLKPFLTSGRTGFYLRVKEPGEVTAGDEIVRVNRVANAMTVREVCHLLYLDKGKNIATARRAAKLEALSRTWRDSFQQIVNAAGG